MNFIRIIKFDFMNIIKNPSLLFSNTIFPLILIGVMGFVTRNSFGAGEANSYDYYGVNMMIFMAMLIAMTASNAFMEETVKKGNIRIVYAPVSKIEIYLSKLISTYLFGTVSFSVLLFVEQTFFNINFGGRNIIYIILLINMLLLFGCSLGTLFCCIFKSEEGASGMLQIPVAIFTVLGGVFFNIHRLGRIVDIMCYLTPVKWVQVCAYKIIYDNDFSIYMLVLTILISCSIACIIISQIIFKPEEYV